MIWHTLLLPVEFYLLAANAFPVFVGILRTYKFKKLAVLAGGNGGAQLPMVILLFVFLVLHDTIHSELFLIPPSLYYTFGLYK
jgi:hypothetical protein